MAAGILIIVFIAIKDPLRIITVKKINYGENPCILEKF
jgi:hypothetical protein